MPNNTVTAFHAITKDLGLPLDWPLPALSSSASAPSNPHANTPILIWGGASSVGQYALQILSHWGYKNLLTTASARHHEYLRVLGARHVFDYRDAEVAASILKAAAAQADRTPVVPFVFDCAASQKGSVAHIAKIAQSGTRVAVLLPVVVRDATDDVAPEYLLDVQAAADWVDGVEVRGVLSLSYQEVSLSLAPVPPQTEDDLANAEKKRMNSLISTCSPPSSRRWLPKGPYARTSKRLWRARRFCSGRRMLWTC